MLKPVPPETGTTAAELDGHANTRLLRGLTLLEENTPASLREAVSCFEEAIELRRQLPLAGNCWFRHGLIAAWMNRGDALTRVGSVDDLHEALRCYDEALLHLRELPMHESPLFIKRLAIAWLNRGFTLMKQATPASVAAAAQCFREAVAAARNCFSANHAAGTALLAGAWMNCGNALIQGSPPDAANAEVSVKEALNLCRPAEPTDTAVAEIGFQARHILCQALIHRLIECGQSSSQRDELLAEATEAVDDGLALARHWEASGSNRFHTQAADLFHFGCRVYQTHQPHFLTEFLLENLDPAHSDGAFAGNLRMHATATDALWRSLGELQRDGFQAMNSPRFDELLEELRDLRIAEERLAALRSGLSSARSG